MFGKSNTGDGSKNVISGYFLLEGGNNLLEETKLRHFSTIVRLSHFLQAFPMGLYDKKYENQFNSLEILQTITFEKLNHKNFI